MKQFLCVVFFVLLFGSLIADATAKDVYQMTVQGVINPPIAQFILESIKKAGDADAETLLILLDTPGALAPLHERDCQSN